MCFCGFYSTRVSIAQLVEWWVEGGKITHCHLINALDLLTSERYFKSILIKNKVKSRSAQFWKE